MHRVNHIERLRCYNKLITLKRQALSKAMLSCLGEAAAGDEWFLHFPLSVYEQSLYAMQERGKSPFPVTHGNTEHAKSLSFTTEAGPSSRAK